MLGPKKIGPNLLLASNKDSSSLFEVPENQVVHLSKKSRLLRPGMPTTVKDDLQTTVEQPLEPAELKSEPTEQVNSDFQLLKIPFVPDDLHSCAFWPSRGS